MKYLSAFCIAALLPFLPSCATADKAYQAYNRIPREARVGYDQERGAYGEFVWKLGGAAAPAGKSIVPAKK